MKQCAMTILFLLILSGVSISSAEGQEFNVKQLLMAEESEAGSSTSGMLKELKSLLSGIDRLLAEIEIPADRQWKRDLFKPLVRVSTGVGKGLVIKNESKKVSIPLVLTGTVVSGDEAMAMFGKREAEAGDMIDGYRIISIEIGQVVVESKKGRRDTLTINGEK